MSQFNWLVDGSIVGVYLLATMIVGVMVRRFVGRVDDLVGKAAHSSRIKMPQFQEMFAGHTAEEYTPLYS